MKNSRVMQIKRSQKTSTYLREISTLIQKLSLDEPTLQAVYVTRVELSNDGGICYVFFSSYTTPEAFEPALELLKLYKSSLRSALAKEVRSRYVPDLRFLYDEKIEKERQIHSLLDEVKEREGLGEKAGDDDEQHESEE